MEFPNFGLRYDLRAPGIAGIRSETLFQTCLEQCVWADALGFGSVTLSEHHGSPDGYLPSPMVLAGAIAAKTEHLRLRIAALIAPLHDPIRLAEDLAVLDLISGGRMDVVLAGGYVASEFELFGKSLRKRPSAVEHAVAVLKQAWSGEPFEYRGQSVQILPRPVQEPRPPILLGGSSKPAAQRAARIADGFSPSLPQYWDDYRDERLRLGKSDPGPRPASVGATVHVARDPDAAWKRIAPYALHEMNAYGKWAAESGADTGYSLIADADALRASGRYRVVTPTECVELVRELGPGGSFGLHPLMGGMHPELSWECLRVVESEVLPQLRP